MRKAETKLTFFNAVIYTRSTGRVVRGWIKDTTTTALYIHDDATGRTVAASRANVQRASA
jgi:hypothetical protein